MSQLLELRHYTYDELLGCLDLYVEVDNALVIVNDELYYEDVGYMQVEEHVGNLAVSLRTDDDRLLRRIYLFEDMRIEFWMDMSEFAFRINTTDDRLGG